MSYYICIFNTYHIGFSVFAAAAVIGCVLYHYVNSIFPSSIYCYAPAHITFDNFFRRNLKYFRK